MAIFPRMNKEWLEYVSMEQDGVFPLPIIRYYRWHVLIKDEVNISLIVYKDFDFINQISRENLKNHVTYQESF